MGIKVLADWPEQDIFWMKRALKLAEDAADKQEVPVGAVLLYEDKCVAEAHNESISACDPSAHAEMLVLRRAATELKNYRLPGTTLYVTLEPCLMCAGALLHARVERLVFAAYDYKTGAVHSVFQVLNNAVLNHRVIVNHGIFSEVSIKLLQNFFRQRR